MTDFDYKEKLSKMNNHRISKQAPVNFEDFKAVMLSEEANERFKYLIKRIRGQIRRGNFENVNTDV